ncbi:DNA primase [Fretibacterium sp. OH1220_COT-178]|uniref:DNA primase n=1 Tax=Fretibacterium sp. OH1220_COT-178 TaxID=2491047 RepID=UPI000F5EFF0B|nr:DNA primase [Fretibacterium sp. OH1220_COT-178]RRD65255.1 DNA primase [Fretibacterium sp. OH1220_COT-178]
MQNDDVKRIKERLDILEVIGDRVRLHRAGRGYLGLCPFHDEKTPSFHVSQERQNYHCFGCGRGGDVFTFVMETEGLEFRQALELLADRAGVALTRPEGRRRTSGNLYEVMDLAEKFFRSLLTAPEGTAVRAYLTRRGLSLDDAARFGLGWSANSWDSLSRHLRGAGVTDREALDAGLVLEGQRGGVYDRFRGRMTFPIRDVAGRVIAFGGRLVDGEGAKYINSPEGAIYSKRRNLYLLHEARGSIRERGRSILVEGYMDAIRLHLNGYTETVASLGTSLTEEQARLLKRFGDRCYICYDSDTAGQEATLRGMYTLQGLGLDVQVISIPTGKDPDDLLSSPDGRATFERALEEARPLVLQHLAAVQPLLERPETRRAGVESLFGGLAQLQPSTIAPNAPQLAGALGFYPHEFWRELEAFRRGRRPEERRGAAEGGNENAAHENPDPEPLEAALCALLWRGEDYRCSSRPEDMLELLSDERVKEVVLAILMESTATLEARWLSIGDRFPLALIARGDAFCDELEHSDSEPWAVVCSGLRRRRDESRLRFLDAKMKRREATLEELAEMQRLAAELKRRR